MQLQTKTNKQSQSSRGKWFATSPHIDRIFGDLPEYSDTFRQNLLNLNISVVIHNGIFAYQNTADPFRSVVNNRRLTTDTPAQWKNTIYLIGTSLVACTWGPDWMTTASYLQRQCNEHQPNQYRVQNLGIPGIRRIIGCAHYLLQLHTLQLVPGDIVIVQDRDVLPDAKKDSKYSIGYILQMDRIARAHGARFIYQQYPRVNRILNPSEHEKTLAAAKSSAELCAGSVDVTSYVPPTEYAEPEVITTLRKFGVEAMDLQPCIERPHDLGEIFIDKKHIVYHGNARLAEATCAYCFGDKPEPPAPAVEQFTAADGRFYDAKAIEHLKNAIVKKYWRNRSIRRWMKGIKTTKFVTSRKIGAIVMNCNPFTLGHLHIIETALQEVSKLFIFVVEENRSVFSYADRLAMVKAGVAHLGDRVFVTGSGQFIISSFSFPEYFTKETILQEIDPSLDLLIFGSVIAPRFNITTRFIGEEPFCMITNQYNAAMLKFLPPLGVAVRVIQRKTTDTTEETTPISASKVRALMQAANYKELQRYIPVSTYNHLVKIGLLTGCTPLPSDKRSASKTAPCPQCFPNKTQKFILACCKPFVRLFMPLEYVIKFECDPSDFFASPTTPIYRYFVSFLTYFGPKPEKTQFKMTTIKKLLRDL